MLFQETRLGRGADEGRAQGQGPDPRAPRKLGWGARGPGVHPGTLAAARAPEVCSWELRETKALPAQGTTKQFCEPVSDTQTLAERLLPLDPARVPPQHCRLGDPKWLSGQEASPQPQGDSQALTSLIT